MGEGEYQVGQVAFLHEDGEVNRVRVLENNSDLKWIRYKLEVVEVTQESNFVKPNKIGQIANIEKLRDMGGGCGGLWYLLDSQ
ncbi:MAG: hypothetical protein Q8L29_00770 [archaeon]|nr:hypothetical protein [archaeon]